MKFHLEILNNRNVGSVDNVHCFCFYKGSDREEDILKRFQPFVRPLKWGQKISNYVVGIFSYF